MAIYSKKVMEHFLHPKNQGKMKNPDSVGKVGNITCGDILWVYIKVKDNKIADVRFETYGCVVAIANSSLVTELVKGKTIDDSLKLTKDNLVKKLGKVPPFKIHCSLLAIDALHEAIYNYLTKKKLPIPKQLQKDHERIIKTLNKIEHKK